ncbi:unnamed protein product, partial [Discosporangium mesarthrocarpum]
KDRSPSSPGKGPWSENIELPYRTAVGSLLWAAITTRLDTANAVREVARYCHRLKRVH